MKNEINFNKELDEALRYTIGTKTNKDNNGDINLYYNKCKQEEDESIVNAIYGNLMVNLKELFTKSIQSKLEILNKNGEL